MYYTDAYFQKTKRCVTDDTVGLYGVFLRHEVVVAIEPAIEFLKANADVEVRRHFPEGTVVAEETALFSYRAQLREVVELETQLLQHVGFSCISAFNAFQMSSICPRIPFLDMAARHCAPDEGGTGMMMSCAYGASIGSKSAQIHAAKGFVGSSLDLTAPYYGDPDAKGLGTMPHVLIGLAGSTVGAMQRFVESNPDDKFIVALVDYYGAEYTDAVACGKWFRDSGNLATKTMGVRLDTHGGRFAEGLTYEQSVEIVGAWLHVLGEYPIVRAVMGEDAFDVASDAARDYVRRVLFGTGVSAASIIRMRQVLDSNNCNHVKIVASSGFNVRKCRIMARAAAPIDMIGTGSFLPETMSESYATADCVAYNGVPSVKVGREWLRDAVLSYWQKGRGLLAS